MTHGQIIGERCGSPSPGFAPTAGGRHRSATRPPRAGRTPSVRRRPDRRTRRSRQVPRLNGQHSRVGCHFSVRVSCLGLYPTRSCSPMWCWRRCRGCCRGGGGGRSSSPRPRCCVGTVTWSFGAGRIPVLGRAGRASLRRSAAWCCGSCLRNGHGATGASTVN